ncbi:MFS transporter [Actinomyces sp. oral taxon 897]|uniref:MFS transporter n=1 Tax=Actinomyces sp. oral taxon 897 TaxID=2081702 RepID=UPI000D03C844|nr:MFS transporter [Actinomyces sp. oral taxon 897]AVM61542.1 MFS transporter [Actinomyces sp. oral taxon 897]
MSARPAPAASGRVLQDWDPEDPQRWSPAIAWRTLVITTYSMVLAFCVWFLPSAIAPKLTEIGFRLSEAQLYWLAAMPGLACGLIRFVYMFLPPIVGTRRLVAYSSLLYALPMLGWFFAVRDSTTGYGVLLALAFACGIGGGSFSGYMPSTGYFFPKRLSGTALGIQAGVGNMGMSIIQLMGPWLMGFGLFGITWIAPQTAEGGPVWVHNVAVFFVPWTILAALLAFTLLKDVPVKANVRQQIDIFSNPDTWYMTLMYVATFGLFSGFAAQFGLLIKNTYGPSSALAATFDASLLPLGATYAFLGPLIGSVVRMCWGPLCDRFGGAVWTFVSLLGMGATLAATTFFLHPTDPSQFPGFLWAMLAMFFFSGLGNAGTFKQMPMIMPKRQAGGAIGFTAAIASLGPFIVGVAIASLGATTWYWISVAYCVLCAVICWIRYARPGAPFPG